LKGVDERVDDARVYEALQRSERSLKGTGERRDFETEERVPDDK
jgi:hypothetical protein